MNIRLNAASELLKALIKKNPAYTNIPEFFQIIERRQMMLRHVMLGGEFEDVLDFYIQAISEFDETCANFTLEELKSLEEAYADSVIKGSSVDLADAE